MGAVLLCEGVWNLVAIGVAGRAVPGWEKSLTQKNLRGLLDRQTGGEYPYLVRESLLYARVGHSPRLECGRRLIAGVDVHERMNPSVTGTQWRILAGDSMREIEGGNHQ